MTYHIETNMNNDYVIVFKDEPSFCYSLSMKQKHGEEIINTGLWLILLFAVWSMPERNAIQTALDAVKTFNGRVNLGVRPFDNHNEFKYWCDEIEEKYGSPIWLFFKEGVKLGELIGIRSENEIKQALDVFLGSQISNDQ